MIFCVSQSYVYEFICFNVVHMVTLIQDQSKVICFVKNV
jgi:hypothetical protein